MTLAPSDIDLGVRNAVRRFWSTRGIQAHSQGTSGGVKDIGARGAVTGGAQMDGFVEFIKEYLEDAGISEAYIFQKSRIELPGWFRAEKKWDLLVVSDGRLTAGIELKSHVGPSFGNNFNNRTEEAIGSATDLWAAYREGAFAPSPPPWLGYLMLLEDSPKSDNPVKVLEPHFEVFPEFKEASYARRYELLLTKLVRERLYNAACLLLARREDAQRGAYIEPSLELAFGNLLSSLVSHTNALTSA